MTVIAWRGEYPLFFIYYFSKTSLDMDPNFQLESPFWKKREKLTLKFVDIGLYFVAKFSLHNVYLG